MPRTARVVVALLFGTHACACSEIFRFTPRGTISADGGVVAIDAGVDGDVGDAGRTDAAPSSWLAPESLALGSYHSCAIFETRGQQVVGCWGSNYQAQLGREQDLGDSPLPVAVVGFEQPVKRIVTGPTANHSCAMHESGDVSCWGNNRTHQLGGLLPRKPVAAPTLLADAGNAMELALAKNHTCALNEEGGVRCWGASSIVSGAQALSECTKLTCGTIHCCALCSNIVRCWGDPAPAGGPTTAQVDASLVAGDDHSCMLAEGRVWCWGAIRPRMLNGGSIQWPDLTEVVVADGAGVDEICSGLHHVCARRDGKIACWGGNYYGQLGEQAGQLFSETPIPITLGASAVRVLCGGMHTCAVLSDGATRCWGSNRSGQIGNGTFSATGSPVAVELGAVDAFDALTDRQLGRACAVGGGVVYCWGMLGWETPSAMPSVQQELLEQPIASVALGGRHGCAIRDVDRRVACWGNNGNRQLGVQPSADTYALPLPALPAVQVAAGTGHSCALAETHELYCWGANELGQLGLDSLAAYELPGAVSGSFVQVSAAGYATCAVTVDKEIQCWGWNGDNIVNTTTQAEYRLPTLVEGISDASQVAVSARHACALTSGGAVYCWGTNEFDVLGATTALGEVSGPTLINTPPAVQLALGMNFTCIIDADANARCWGNNHTHQLGTAVDATQSPEPQLFEGPFDRISAGYGFVCARSALDSTLRCWGDYSMNQLGNTAYVNDPTLQDITNLQLELP